MRTSSHFCICRTETEQECNTLVSVCVDMRECFPFRLLCVVISVRLTNRVSTFVCVCVLLITCLWMCTNKYNANTMLFHVFQRPFLLDIALWFRTTKSRDINTGPLICPFAHPLAPLTYSLAPHCLLCLGAPLQWFVHPLAHSLLRLYFFFLRLYISYRKRFIRMIKTRWFHTVSTHSATSASRHRIGFLSKRFTISSQ